MKCSFIKRKSCAQVQSLNRATMNVQHIAKKMPKMCEPWTRLNFHANQFPFINPAIITFFTRIINDSIVNHCSKTTNETKLKKKCNQRMWKHIWIFGLAVICVILVANHNQTLHTVLDVLLLMTILFILCHLSTCSSTILPSDRSLRRHTEHFVNKVRHIYDRRETSGF